MEVVTRCCKWEEGGSLMCDRTFFWNRQYLKYKILPEVLQIMSRLHNRITWKTKPKFILRKQERISESFSLEIEWKTVLVKCRKTELGKCWANVGVYWQRVPVVSSSVRSWIHAVLPSDGYIFCDVIIFCAQVFTVAMVGGDASTTAACAKYCWKKLSGNTAPGKYGVIHL